MSSDPHTQVPNLIYDLVLPVVREVERDCLLYIIRRTYGFSDGQGERKKRDVISLKQFELGITTGDYLLDLGTNRSRGAIRQALEGLEKKELVESRYACLRCMWEERSESQPHSDNTCPRCNASLAKSWCMAEITPNKILNLLNADSRQQTRGRRFEWDAEKRRFKVFDENRARQVAEDKQKLDQEFEALTEALWYPELVDEAVRLAGKKLKNGHVSRARQVNNFLKPVINMQNKYRNPALIKYALEQTIAGPVFTGDRPTNNWDRYAEKVAANSARQFANTPSEKDHGESAKEAELRIRNMLREAARLNGSGENEQARAMLDEILSEADAVISLFDSLEQVQEQIRLAFKQGESDFAATTADTYAPDYLSA